jgi:hypothetical protein
MVLFSAYLSSDEWLSDPLILLHSTLFTWVLVNSIPNGELDVIFYFCLNSWCHQTSILCRSSGRDWGYLVWESRKRGQVGKGMDAQPSAGCRTCSEAAFLHLPHQRAGFSKFLKAMYVYTWRLTHSWWGKLGWTRCQNLTHIMPGSSLEQKSWAQV